MKKLFLLVGVCLLLGSSCYGWDFAYTTKLCYGNLDPSHIMVGHGVQVWKWNALRAGGLFIPETSVAGGDLVVSLKELGESIQGAEWCLPAGADITFGAYVGVQIKNWVLGQLDWGVDALVIKVPVAF